MPDADSILRSPVCLRVYVYAWLFVMPRSVPCLRNMHLLGLHVYRYDTQRLSMLMPSASLQDQAPTLKHYPAGLCLDQPHIRHLPRAASGHELYAL